MKTYLLKDYRDKNKDKPELSIITEMALFELLQNRPKDIVITDLPKYDLIDWN